MTYLCVPIFVQSFDQASRDIALATEAGAEMIEFRLDRLTGPMRLPDSPVPSIFTCRPVSEGGESELDDQQRLDLLAAVSQAGGYVDVELETIRRRPDALDLGHYPRRLIISIHDFKGRPRLSSLAVELTERRAHVNKFAWMARSIRDNLEAFEMVQHRPRATVALCMGEAGLISRVLAKKFGAFLTFASLRDQSATAPGQVTIHDMKRLYRWDAMNASTKVYGVVASPVMHSMSPAVHNAAFEATQYDGVYLPLLVQPGYESFKAFMESFLAFEPLGLSGLSVTLPHKQNALRYLQEKGAAVEPLAQAIGAVNTLLIDRADGHSSGSAVEPRLRGINTDYSAILDSITSALGISREQLAGYRVAVLGAGGTGRTAVAALAHYGATIVVYNRTKDRADALAAEFNGKSGKVVSATLDKLSDTCCQIVINTTSVGMHPHVDASPLGDRLPKFTADTLVFDTIYNPATTKLLRQASQAGARTLGGIEMFVRQAAAQFHAWTGRPAPVEVMRGVVEARLSSPAGA